ncbi:MAG: sugar ABC transporter substrate-binding protein [Actinomycetota bacterium]|nr:sugar ABC transporter substrate-binding protein [Actinomycetota bacterium]
MHNFRRFQQSATLFLVRVVATGLLAGCGGDTVATPGATAASTTAAASPADTATSASAAAPTAAASGASLAAGVSNKYSGTTLNVVFANHAWATGIQPLLAQFQQASGIKVSISSYGETQLSDQLTTRFTAGGGTIDAFMFRPLQEGKLFANNGWLQDMTTSTGGADWNWSDFQAPSRGTVTFDGKVYGVPIVTEREILYYRKDLLQAKGITVPKTLDDLMVAAQKLNDPTNGMYGFVARGMRAAAVTQFSSYLYGFGGDWAKNGASAIGSPEAVQAYKFYGKILHDYGAPGVLNMNWPQAIAIFGQGKAAMYTDADSLYPNLLDKTKSIVTDKVGYAVFPAGPAGAHPYNVTSWALGVSAASKNQDAALEFVKWATSQPVVAQLQAGGLPGARASVWNSPQGTSGFPAELAKVIQDSAATGIDHDRPLVVHVAQARDIVGGPIVTAIQGQDVDAAVKQADPQFGDFLKTDLNK